MLTEDTNKTQIIDDDQLLEWITCWRSEGLTPIFTIKGYAELLLKGLAGELTEEQRRFVEIIFRNCDRAADWFRLPAAYLTFRLERHHVHWEEICLSDLVVQILSSVQVDDIEVDLPDDLPAIRGDQCLKTAILYLIEPDPFLARDDALQTRIVASLVKGPSILIQIHTGVHLNLIKGNAQPSFFPGTRLSVADQIIRLLGSKIQVQVSGGETEFRFALPVWKMLPNTPRLIELTHSNNGDQVNLMQGQDLIVRLEGVLDNLSWRITDLDSLILANTGVSWHAAKESELELRFWTFRTGLTPLRIEYNQTSSSEMGIFSVQVEVRPHVD